MKRFKIILSLLMLITAINSVDAQSYVRMKKDYDAKDTDNTIKLYSLSVLELVEAVYIIEVINVTQNALEKEASDSSGIVVGAKFDVVRYDQATKKILFKDNTGRNREDVKGVTIKSSISGYRVKYRTDKLTIPVNSCDVIKGNISNIESLKSLFQDSYICGSDLHLVNSSNYDMVIVLKNTPLKLNSGNDIIKEINKDESIYFIINDTDVIVPDFEMKRSEFRKATLIEKIKNNMIIVLIITASILMIIAGGLFYWFRRGRTGNNAWAKEEYIDDIDTISPKKEIEKNKTSSIQSYDNSSYKVDFTQVLDKIAELDKKQNKSNEQLRDMKKEIMTISTLITNNSPSSQAQQELERERKQLKTDLDTCRQTIKNHEKALECEKLSIDDKNKKNAFLTTQVKKMQNEIESANEIPNTIRISGYESFIRFSKELLDECLNSEQQIKEFIQGLDEEGKERMGYHMMIFVMNRPSDKISIWREIISGLDINGYVKHTAIVSYLKVTHESEQSNYLSKHFYEDVVKLYVSAILVLLEEVRNAKTIGVTQVVPQSIKNSIQSIINLCNVNNISITYVELLKKLNSSDYELFDIEENLPKPIARLLGSSIEKDIILHINKYAVNMKNNEIKEKTSCIAKIL